jgi:hypothetical protein
MALIQITRPPIDLAQHRRSPGVRWADMAPFLSRCPATGLQVQGWAADGDLENGEVYEAVTCLACGRQHLVNPKTGKVLGAVK